ncbi:MAG: permease [Saprospiraceae bacterium]|nr:permease [Saprospiraceae bacterium]
MAIRDQERVLDYFLPVARENEIEKADFIRKTYWHVALAVLGFVAVEALFLNTPFILSIGLKMAQGWTWLLVLGGFMFVTNMATRWAHTSTNRNQQYLALGLYVVAEAFIFIPLIYIAIASTGDFSLINQAAVMTLTLFIALSAVVILTRKDFSFLRSIITVGSFIAIGLVVAGMLFGFTLGLWFSVAMVALAAGSILYQTSNMVHEYHKEQYVAASMGLFASLMLLFWYILSILLRLSSNN